MLVKVLGLVQVAAGGDMRAPPQGQQKALARVRRNKGAPGLDGMTVEELGAHLKDHWPEIRSRLLGRELRVPASAAGPSGRRARGSISVRASAS